jgi:hypothetical protein
MNEEATYATSTTQLTIDQVAERWGVSSKSIEAWTETVYQAFGVKLPKKGPFTLDDLVLLDEVGKHVSAKAVQYFDETGETRRLKAAEFVKKTREAMQNSEKFQNFQNFQEDERSPETYAPVGEASEDEAFGELGLVVREMRSETAAVVRTVEQWEDQQIEQVANFIEDTPNRMLRKLAQRLSSGRSNTRKAGSLTQAVSVAFQVAGKNQQALPESQKS